MVQRVVMFRWRFGFFCTVSLALNRFCIICAPFFGGLQHVERFHHPKSFVCFFGQQGGGPLSFFAPCFLCSLFQGVGKDDDGQRRRFAV
jgi:hypothetical protein